mmetsp:Transcript_25893/g.74069  ORF Transcript_25893/g.74069 Transcript_25893/m.74069 type:complete len:273 (-) Transcript_25893:206-1024(-)
MQDTVDVGFALAISGFENDLHLAGLLGELDTLGMDRLLLILILHRRVRNILVLGNVLNHRVRYVLEELFGLRTHGLEVCVVVDELVHGVRDRTGLRGIAGRGAANNLDLGRHLCLDALDDRVCPTVHKVRELRVGDSLAPLHQPALEARRFAQHGQVEHGGDLLVSGQVDPLAEGSFGNIVPRRDPLLLAVDDDLLPCLHAVATVSSAPPPTVELLAVNDNLDDELVRTLLLDIAALHDMLSHRIDWPSQRVLDLLQELLGGDLGLDLVERA